MLWTIIVVLFLLWLFGIIANVGGFLINLLLVGAIILFVYNLLAGRNRV